MKEKEIYTVSKYLIQRLEEAGIGHLFGVPGDYVLDFLDVLVASPLEWVGTCNELNAGYAADGYARMNGAGAAVVTYCVGGFSILNAVAGAYAERVPMIVISGAPPTKRRESGALVHHLVANYDLQLDVFKNVCIDAAILSDAEAAPALIDRVISNSLHHKLPVYLELPADIALAPCTPPQKIDFSPKEHSDESSLEEAADAAAKMINQASSPVVLVGIETLRYALGDETLQLVESAELPYATMLSSKSVLPELHPQFVGIYQGGWSRETVRNQVESSDCLISLGVWMTDLDTGMFSVNFKPEKMINASGDTVYVGNQLYKNVKLEDFIHRLLPKLENRSYLTSHPHQVRSTRETFIPQKDQPLTAIRAYERINTLLDDDMVLLTEPGDSFCAAGDFQVEEAENFIVQAFYSSIGFCTPAALGVALARKDKRPVVLTGDGAFQMTAQEVSTLIRIHSNTIFLIINNDGYLIERELHEDGPYNDIQMWNYSDLPAALGASDNAIGIRVQNESELDDALLRAAKDKNRLYLIDIVIPDRSCSAGLKQLGESFRKAAKKS
jgi:TPP-dependent 2-oxoacid decarboxylase